MDPSSYHLKIVSCDDTANVLTDVYLSCNLSICGPG